MVIATRKKFTIAEYHQLVDLGFFTEDEKIELIRGEIINMAPKRTPHSVCNSLLWKKLYQLIGQQAEIRVQEPITLPSDSEPEPDVVVAKLKADNYLSAHPVAEDIILVVEIADSTLKYDREVKIPLYAEAGINDYWIFNLVDKCLEVYTKPFSRQNGNFNYQTRNIILADGTIEIPGFSDLVLELATVFPQ